MPGPVPLTVAARLPAPDPDGPAEAVAHALRRRPSALFTDIDGTLSPLVDTPGGARVLEGGRRALRALVGRCDLVCVLTGRPADDAWRMVGVDEAVYVGNHGAETWRRGELLRPAGIERYQPRVARAAALLRVALAGVPGIAFEDKGIAIAVHFRRDERQAQSVREAAERVARRRGLQVVTRTAHVEVRPPLPGDKGTALAELAERHALRGLVVLGDDPVDAPAFAAARAYAARTGAAVVVVTVGGLRPAGDVDVAGPEAVAELLLDASRSMGT